MIRLFTGRPGTGKTNRMVSLLLKSEFRDKLIFQHGINELKLPDIPSTAITYLFCDDPNCTVCPNIDRPVNAPLVADWQNLVPVGGILIVDEAQMIFRPRSSRDRDIPESLTALETHRHGGTDIYFLTQHPSFVDIHIRRLANQHIHTFMHWTGYRYYEFLETCAEPAESRAKSHKSEIDKKANACYKSAEVHTEVKRNIPCMAYVYLAIFVIGIPVMVYNISKLYSAYTGGSEFVADVDIDGIRDSSVPDSPAAAPRSARTTTDTPTNSEKAFMRAPLVEGHPESAPAYEHLVEVKSYPRVAGCISAGSYDGVDLSILSDAHLPNFKCQCYTQQATKIEVPVVQCIEFVRNPPFNPYLDSKSNSNTTRQSAGFPVSRTTGRASINAALAPVALDARFDSATISPRR